MAKKKFKEDIHNKVWEQIRQYCKDNNITGKLCAFGDNLSKFIKYNVCEIEFNVVLDRLLKCDSYRSALTKEKMILVYGDIEGNKRWESYCHKQAVTNTFEYKNEKYGMTAEEFKEYNASRAVTLENLINRHGELIGNKMWKDYCERQAYAGVSLEYFIEKYGEGEGKRVHAEVNKKKGQSFDAVLTRFGGNYEKALEHYMNLFKSRVLCATAIKSAVSDSFIAELMKELPNHEFEIEYCVFSPDDRRAYSYDLFIKDIGLIIEFNGDLFHGNPHIFEANDLPIHKYCGEVKTAQEMWEFDKRKCDVALKYGSNVKWIHYVWERDFRVDKTKQLNIALDIVRTLENSYGD